MNTKTQEIVRNEAENIYNDVIFSLDKDQAVNRIVRALQEEHAKEVEEILDIVNGCDSGSLNEHGRKVLEQILQSLNTKKKMVQ